MQARDFFDEPAREATPEPVRTQPAEQRADTPASAPAPAPAAPAAAVVFHAVSEHDAVLEEAHRPVRRRRHGQPEGQAAEAPLQMVETQAQAPAAIAIDDEPPRRTRPRKRRGGAVASEPLMMVETQPGAEGGRPDNLP
jgi:hypothetical protein